MNSLLLNLKLFYRSLAKHRLYNIINLLGLSVGMVCFVFITLYLNYENSFDNWHTNFDKVYRVGRAFTEKDITPSTSPPLGPMLKNAVPEIDNMVRIRRVWRDVLLKTDKGSFYEKDYFKVDSTFFRVFPYRLSHGDTATALRNPDGIILSAKLSQKIFGEKNALGRRIQINGDRYREVTGVLEDPAGPGNLNFEAITPLKIDSSEHWGYNNLLTFISFKKPLVNIKQTEQLISESITGLLLPVLEKDKDGPINYMLGQNGKANIYLEAVKNIHLQSRDGSFKNRYIINQSLTFIAFAIILLVCINFSGLSIALLSRRIKENTVKYVFGHRRGYLLLMQLLETLIQCVVALLLAIIIVEICTPGFNKLLNVNLQLGNYFQLWQLLPKLLIGIVAMVILSGFYPAYVLSRLSPSEILKGQFSNSRKGIMTRKALITVQLAITILFLGGGLIIYKQIQYLQKIDLGFQPEDVMVVKVDTEDGLTKFKTIKQRLLQIPNVLAVSRGNSYPADNKGCAGNTYHYKDKHIDCCYTEIDVDYFETLGIPVLEGRSFKKGSAQDSTYSIIINEAALKQLGLKQANNVVMTQENYTDSATSQMIPLPIIGVVKNFHRNKFEEEIHPTIYSMNAPSSGDKDYIIIRYKSESLVEVSKQVENVINVYNAPFPLRFTFLTDKVDELMEDYYRYGKLFLILLIVSLIISGIGLTALISYTVTVKAKEISVRKVLGASYFQVIRLFQREYVFFILLSVVLAIPLIIIGGYSWLETFVYRIDMPWPGIIIMAMILILLILLVITLQVKDFAKTKPIDYLKYE